MLRPVVALTCAFALTVTGCAALKSKPAVYEITLAPTAGNTAAGKLTMSAVPDGVHLQGHLTGLTPGSTHGFHIHEHGDCSAPDASTAGGHFNPNGTEHGDPAGLVHHAGDISNQIADAQGAVDVDLTMHGVSIGTSTPDDVLGRSLVVHRDADDYATQPSGNSGPRIACGVILKKP
ncbi:MAG TPA: superoxide dismutase family protein [Xanthomonadaceae bacterium]|nr:superoxide dismutase family protein [Xanthomonadaceae bacterium]